MFGEMSAQPEKGRKLVERMCRLQLIGVAETKAILDMCKWPGDDFKSLLEVLVLFENYETEDVKEMKRSVNLNQGKLSRGEILNMNNKTLIALSKVDSIFFAKESEKVIAKEVSVQSLISNYEMVKDLTKLTALVEELSKRSMNELQTSFPNQFNSKTLGRFVGAEVSRIKSNTIGELLKKYIEAVLNGNGSKVDSEIVMLEHATPRLIMESEEVRSCDVRVFYLNKSENEESVNPILDQATKSKIPTILLFDTEEEQLDAYMTLKVKVTDNFQVSQIFFDKDCPQETSKVFTENLVFGVVCGNLSNTSCKMKLYNGNITNLRTLCENLSTEGSTFESVTEDNQPIVKIHSKNLERSVVYISTKIQLEKLRDDMTKEEGFISKHRDSNIEVDFNPEENKKTEKMTEEDESGIDLASTYNFVDQSRDSGHRSEGI